MVKEALLIGVSNYRHNLPPLPAAVRDVQALARVLKHPEMGNFDHVQILVDQTGQTIREAIEKLFSYRKRDDLTFLFFSGHGIKDEYGKLYFAVPNTYKDERGELVRSSAVSASFVQDTMNRSPSRRQIVVLDCCFSGAFGDGYSAKDNEVIDLERELGGEGRAVLTSSNSTQYSFEQHGADLSIYTQFLVEGIESGEADSDRDGVISTNELHEFTRRKVRDIAPAMKPKIFVGEQGFKIYVAQALSQDPSLQYRREVERVTKYGVVSDVARKILDTRRLQLNLSVAQTKEIEAETLKFHQQYQQALVTYEKAYRSELGQSNPIPPHRIVELDRLKEVLKLEEDDVQVIKARISAENEVVGFSSNQGLYQSKSSPEQTYTSYQVPLESGVEASHNIRFSAPVSPANLAAETSEIVPAPSDSEGKPRFQFRGYSFYLTSIISIIGVVAATAMAVYAFRVLSEEGEPKYTTVFLPKITAEPLEELTNSLLNLRLSSMEKLAQGSLNTAWAYYQEGNLDLALDTLRKVPPDSPQYQHAQAGLISWPQESQRNSLLADASRQAIAIGDLANARQQANAINTTTIYWQNIQAALNSDIAQAQQRLDAARPQAQPENNESPVPRPEDSAQIPKNVVPEPNDSQPESEESPENFAQSLTLGECQDLLSKYADGDIETRERVNAGADVRNACRKHNIEIPF